MAKDLLINIPTQGISASPHVGFSDVRNLDIFSIPGVAKLNNILAKKSETTITNTVQWFARNPKTPTEAWAVDASGNVYKSANVDTTCAWSAVTGNAHTCTISNASPAVVSATAHGFAINDKVIFSTTGTLPTGVTAGTTYYIISAGFGADSFRISLTLGGTAINTSTAGSGTHSFLTNGAGLAIWKDYLFVPRASSIDVYGPLSASPTWTNNWKKIDCDSLWHPLFVSSNDNKLYGGAGKYVFSLDENSGQTFAPGTSASFTFTQQALDLPPDYRIKCLEELGNNLMIGTWMGTNVYDFKIADIFSWDRSSVSFGQPVRMTENGVHAMLNINGILYVMAGVEGKMYYCNGVQATLISQIPQSLADISGGKYLEIYPGALVNYKGRPFFGLSGGGTSAIDGMGVYSLSRTSKGNILTLEHAISTLSYGATYVLKIGALLPITRDSILVGWRDNTTYGIDLTTNTSYAYGTDYSGYFVSPLYQVGTPLVGRQFTQGEFNLSKELATGEGVRISYRVNLTDSFTVLGTFTYAVLGAVTSHNFATDIPDCESLQIKVELLGTSTTTPSLISVTFR